LRGSPRFNANTSQHHHCTTLLLCTVASAETYGHCQYYTCHMPPAVPGSNYRHSLCSSDLDYLQQVSLRAVMPVPIAHPSARGRGSWFPRCSPTPRRPPPRVPGLEVIARGAPAAQRAGARIPAAGPRLGRGTPASISHPGGHRCISSPGSSTLSSSSRPHSTSEPRMSGTAIRVP
jgi:hypothetical protein